jgi:hypothetical protein
MLTRNFVSDARNAESTDLSREEEDTSDSMSLSNAERVNLDSITSDVTDTSTESQSRFMPREEENSPLTQE